MKRENSNFLSLRKKNCYHLFFISFSWPDVMWRAALSLLNVLISSAVYTWLYTHLQTLMPTWCEGMSHSAPLFVTSCLRCHLRPSIFWICYITGSTLRNRQWKLVNQTMFNDIIMNIDSTGKHLTFKRCRECLPNITDKVSDLWEILFSFTLLEPCSHISSNGNNNSNNNSDKSS